MPTGAELATAWVRLVPSMDGAQGEIVKGVGGEVEKAGKKAGGKFSTGFKAGITALSAVVVGTIGKVLGDAIADASDLNEAGTAVGAVFGNSFKDIDKWAGQANTKLGQSHVEALNAAKTFGVFGQAAGLSAKENAKFSTGLAELASDFASFHNVSPEEAIQAIGSGLRGEAEPLRKFGVLMDDAALKAQAMKMGLIKSTASTADLQAAQIKIEKSQRAYNEAVKKYGKGSLEARDAQVSLSKATDDLGKLTKANTTGPLTQQQKILAANALIFSQAGAAQGDFTKTSEGMANQQRIVDASMKNLSATIGTALMPIMQGLLAIAQPVVAWLTENPALVTALAIAMGVLAVAIIGVNIAMWAMALNPVVATVMGVALAVVALIAGIVLLIMNWDAVVAWLKTVWDAVVKWFIDTLNTISKWWNGVWKEVSSFFTTIWTNVTSWFVGLWTGLITWYINLIIGIALFILNKLNEIAGFWRAVWNGVVSFFTGLWNGVVSFVSGIFKGISDTINGALKWIGDAWHDAWSGMVLFLKNTFSGIVGVIKAPINGIISLINGAIGGINAISITIPDWVPGIGGQKWGLSIPRIPMLAAGGTITASGYTVVGENGPELLKLPKGAQVNPDYDDLPDDKGVTFNNYAPLGQSPAQALTAFSNRAKGL